MKNIFSGLKKWGTKSKKPHCTAIVAAAGNAVRMDGEDKLFTYIAGVPVIVYTLMALSGSDDIDEIIVAARAGDIFEIGKLCKDYNLTKVSKIVKGGETRIKSVLAGLGELSGKSELVAIHDGARPLVTDDIISEAVKCAALCGAAAPAVALKDTIRIMESDGKVKTLDRDKLFAVQTPQVFQAEIIRAALARAVREEAPLTDDCEAVLRIGMNVEMTRGSYENIKITTPEDMKIAEAFILSRRGRAE